MSARSWILPACLLAGGLASSQVVITVPRGTAQRMAPHAPARPTLAPVLDGTVRLNEILYHEEPGGGPLRDHEWVEIVNTTATDIDLTGWALADRGGLTGPAARDLPAVVLPGGARLVVHIGSGADELDFSDGWGEHYTGDAPGTLLFDNMLDDCALYAPSGIFDYVCWSFGPPPPPPAWPGTAHADAVLALRWTMGAFVNTARLVHAPYDKFRTVRPGMSIGRDRLSTDTDRPEDWDARGGEDAGDITPCLTNWLVRPFVPADDTPPAGAEWTVMLYSDGDSNLESALFDDVKEIELAGGSDDSVNVVVMFDGLDQMQQAALDGGGDLVPVAGTLGGTFRFRVGSEVDTRYVRMLSPAGDDPYLGERNMGDPAELAAFIAWAELRYPAQKYALILSDHGGGWKGVCTDDTSTCGEPTTNCPNKLADRNEAMFMGELSSALSGSSFELIGFDACLMGMVEVAWQVEPFARYFVASEELEQGDGWPYDTWLPGLKANPGWSGFALGARIVADFTAFYSAAATLDPFHTLACIDLAALPALMPLVSAVADDLALGCDDFQSYYDPLDNVEHLLSLQAESAQRFDDNNFVDLYDFTDQVLLTAAIPDCYKDMLVPMQLALLASIVAEANGPGSPDANGLSIHFPLLRTAGGKGDPYDRPGLSRVAGRDSPRAGYAANDDCLPLAARDVESGAALAAPGDWVLVPSPGFRFPVESTWDEFLQRYYHPVADIWIEYAFCPPDGPYFGPYVTDPGCGANLVAEIEVCPCAIVLFTARGSSDADTPDKLAAHWMWDFDDLMEHGTLSPTMLAAGTDAATADDDMDLDCDPAELDDERQADLVDVAATFPELRDYVVTVNAWDDNHTFEFHDTNPAATFVHPQSDGHIAIVHVVPCPFFH